MTSLKRELAGDREAADNWLLKKLKLEKAPTFKKKAHEKQFQFNEEVATKLDSASASLSETPPAVEKAKTLLEEGMKLVSERQKLIRMADRSEHGWATVSVSGVVPMVAQPVAGYATKWSGALSAVSTSSPPVQDPCFNCGILDHVKKFCPLL